MSNHEIIAKRQVLPVLPLRGITVFPFMILHFDVGRLKSIKALEDAMIQNQFIFLVAQKDPRTDSPTKKEMYKVGTISKVKQLLRLPGDTIRVLVEGISRAKVRDFTNTDPFFTAEVEVVNESPVSEDAETEALCRQLVATFEDYVRLNNKVASDTLDSIMNISDANQLADIIASNVFLQLHEKQTLLSTFDAKLRLKKLMEFMVREIEIMGIEKDIGLKVRKQIEKTQKEYYLREQLKAIQSELGDQDGILEEIQNYKKKAKESHLPDEVSKKLHKELDRLQKIPSGSAEGAVVRNYVEWILDLPWSNKTTDHIDLTKAKKVLDEDHYGLSKVKERIIEYLAVSKMKNDLKGPILCLVGPPGVGKTSIAKSIAKSLNRNYVRISLGGVKDESEIRGHRRTYVGSMPGRIIHSLKQAQSNNPLILLDEIDKMSNDFRGDPTSAMLEVLDGEQNHSFRDHFLELPFDLSDVLFLTTANHLDSIPRPLMDRLEIIELSSYTADEKVMIAKKHLIPKQILAHGLKKSALKISDKGIQNIIEYYTRESGVRNLERKIAKLCRKSARKLLEEKKNTVQISSANLESFLGSKSFTKDRRHEKGEVGVATGLAWTPVGGDILSIEVLIVPGKGRIELTGHLGDVMKESARAAMSYIRANASRFGVDATFSHQSDIHIHVPEGAVPKDGPSAGITLLTAIVSALTSKPVDHTIAMTGEITLRGRVLPIGGLKEKTYAALRSGIKKVIIPFENQKDLDELSDHVKKNLSFVFVKTGDEVLLEAIQGFDIFRVKKDQKNSNEMLTPPLAIHEDSIDGMIEQ